MWTRLLYLKSIPEGIKPFLDKGKWHRPIIGGRYHHYLRKQFLLNNVPWIYDKEVDSSKNPRNKKPKGHKSEKNKIIRLEKIKKALESNVENELKYRQEKLNNRKLGGMDRLMQLNLPTWIAYKPNQVEGGSQADEDEAIYMDRKVKRSFVKKVQKKPGEEEQN